MPAIQYAAMKSASWFFLIGCYLIAASVVYAAESEKSSQPLAQPSQAQSSPAPKRTQQDFLNLMTKTHQFVDEKNWLGAAQTVRDALLINPESQAAIELSSFIYRHLTVQSNEERENQFKTLVAHEMWSDANELAKTLANSSEELATQIDRVAKLTVIEQELAALLSQPSLLAKKPAIPRIERINRMAESIDPGTRVAAQLIELGKEHKRWNTPVRVTLVSDEETNVLIRPGRALGKFKVKHLELMPGDYVLLGRRQGYRESRESLSLNPDAPPSRVTVKADQQF